MIYPRDGLGLGIALSLASICLIFPATTQAQDAPPAEGAPAANDEAAAPTPAAPDEAPGGEPAREAAEGPAPEAEAPPAPEAEAPPAPDAEAAAPAEAKAPEAEKRSEKVVKGRATAKIPSEPQPLSAEAKQSSAGKVVVVEQLPGSAYPSIQVRGIVNGSLWRTFHGQQWPYVPDSPMHIGVSGYVWNDLSNTQIDVDKSLAGANINDQNRWTTQTRGVLRLTPTVNAGGKWFVQGNAELVVQGDMRPDPSSGVLATTDDLWVRAGMWDLFDLTVGRFQGWEIANHYGMALDINTLERSGAWLVSSSLPKPTDGYGLTYFWDRQNFRLGGYALHLYPTKFLRVEVLSHAGEGGSSNAGSPYQIDVRPSAIFDIGFLKLKAGYEYGKASPQDAKQVVRDSMNGFGFAAQIVLDPYVELGGSFARGYQDVIDKDNQADLAASNTVQTVGGFLNASPAHKPLVFGFGAFLNQWEDFRIDANVGEHQGKVDTNEQWVMFGAAQYTLWTRLNLKLVASHASNKVEHYNAGSYINNALSGRFRAELLF